MGESGQPRPTSCGPTPRQHRVRPQLRQVSGSVTKRSLRSRQLHRRGRRGLQWLVDVHDPAQRRRGTGSAVCRCSSSGTTANTDCAAAQHGYPHRHACRVRRSGTWRGATRTTPSTGRPTSTCAIGWWWPRCTGMAIVNGLIGSSSQGHASNTFCALSIRPSPSRTSAIADFLAGPEHIFSILESALPEVRKMRAQYPDAVVLPSATALPTPSDKRWRKKVQIPVSPIAIAVAADPRCAPSAEGARPAASPTPSDQRRHAGRALVLAVQGRRRHRHHGGRPRASSTASATARRCSSCSASR